MILFASLVANYFLKGKPPNFWHVKKQQISPIFQKFQLWFHTPILFKQLMTLESTVWTLLLCVKDERECKISVVIDVFACLKTSLCSFRADPGIKLRHGSENATGRIESSSSNAWNITKLWACAFGGVISTCSFSLVPLRTCCVPSQSFPWSI